jgi:XTP/dITP diphosphohydrolase
MSSRELVLATRNRHKVAEISAILGPDFRLTTLEMYPEAPEVEEDGATFSANAGKKALTIAQNLERWALADDSGLVVEALSGAPGVYSARYAGETATDAENNARLLAALSGVPEAGRRAQFVCVIAAATPRGLKVEAVGRCPGRIAVAGQGDGGFGYDPLFIPDGYDCSFAELPPEEKNRISHRARALRQLPELIARLEQMSTGKERFT